MYARRNQTNILLAAGLCWLRVTRADRSAGRDSIAAFSCHLPRENIQPDGVGGWVGWLVGTWDRTLSVDTPTDEVVSSRLKICNRLLPVVSLKKQMRTFSRSANPIQSNRRFTGAM